MRQCRLRRVCTDCERRFECPAAVRRDKRARRPMSDSASTDLLRRAARILSTDWHTCETLGMALYGAPGPGRKERMSIMVRARRPINRLRKMGVLAVRPGVRRSVEYTLLPGGVEALG